MLSKIGYSTVNGRNNDTLKKRLEYYEISTQHFSSVRRKTNWTDEEIFCENSKVSQNKLRRTFKERNFVPYKCAVCGLEPFWNGKPLVLTLDHKNGKNKDDRIENLRWICPNCDRQSDTYGYKNKKNLEKGNVLHPGNYNHTHEDVENYIVSQQQNSRYYIDCDSPIDNQPIRYSKYSGITRRKVEKPLKEDLENLIKKYNGNFSAVSRLYNVTDNTIRKWCKNYNLPIHSKDYKLPKQIQKTKPLVIYPVDQIDIKTGEVVASFKSISEAERVTKIYHITEASDPDNTTRNVAGGYLWRRK